MEQTLHPLCLTGNPNLAAVTLADITSASPEVVYVNEGFTKITGYTLKDIETELGGVVWKLLRQEERDYLKNTYRMKYTKNTGYQCQYQIIHKNGTLLHVLDNGYFFEDERGRACAQMILTDVTGIRAGGQEVYECHKRLSLGLKSSNACVFEVDLCRPQFTYFENAAGLFGFGDDVLLEEMNIFEGLIGEAYWDAVTVYLSHPDDHSLVREVFDRALDGCPAACEARIQVRGGRFVWCKLTVTPVPEEQTPVRLIGVLLNINQIRVRTEKYKRRAARDLYTGLYNKQHTRLLIRGALSSMPGKRHAMILIDIDNLKQLNDRFGHDAGDEAIREVSRQIRRVFRRNDVVGRFGGDEFVVFMKDIPGRAAIESRIGEVMNSLESHPVTKSIGIALYPADGAEFDSLFKCADIALYESKKHKNAYTFYGEKTQAFREDNDQA